MMTEITKVLARTLGDAIRPALESWNRTARLAFLLIVLAIAATIFARYR